MTQIRHPMHWWLHPRAAPSRVRQGGIKSHHGKQGVTSLKIIMENRKVIIFWATSYQTAHWTKVFQSWKKKYHSSAHQYACNASYAHGDPVQFCLHTRLAHIAQLLQNYSYAQTLSSLVGLVQSRSQSFQK